MAPVMSLALIGEIAACGPLADDYAVVSMLRPKLAGRLMLGAGGNASTSARALVD